jgi:hypothetical protein
MPARIVDDIRRCEGCSSHYNVRLAARLKSPDAQRWCAPECSKRQPKPRDVAHGDFVQACIDQILPKKGLCGEWASLLPEDRLEIWREFVATSAPRREPAIQGHSTGL